jgi:hypothetical protein
MREDKTLVEKIEELACLGEIEGAESQIRQEGRITPEVSAAIALRRAEIMKRAKIHK